MKKIVFIAPADAALGFSLAGVSVLLATPDRAEALLDKVLTEPDTGVAVIDERLAAAIDPERFREMERRWFGILLVLPAPTEAGREGAEEYVLRLIRQAIGYHVRVQT